MIAVGKRNTLTVLKESTPGLYLDGGEQGEILLPGRYIAPGVKPGDQLDVFVYRDSEDRLVATTETPFAMVGEFVCLEVIGVNRNVGAFLNWGLAKDLLLPFREQTDPVETGDRVVVYIYVDDKTDRIVASMRFNRHLGHVAPNYRAGQQVSVLVASRTPSGYNVIVENAHRGLLYVEHMHARLEIGKKISVYVRAVRPDGKLDLSLDATGYKRVAPLTDQIIKALEASDGHLSLDDDSPPQFIRETFGVSKKAFKQALGALYKARRIVFENPGIRLVNTEDGAKN